MPPVKRPADAGTESSPDPSATELVEYGLSRQATPRQIARALERAVICSSVQADTFTRELEKLMAPEDPA